MSIYNIRNKIFVLIANPRQFANMLNYGFINFSSIFCCYFFMKYLEFCGVIWYIKYAKQT